MPDFVQYKDQIEEVNELTARISSLTESVKVKGFYPAGASDIGEAIEAAIKSADNRTILVPVSNWAAFGDLGSGEPIIWLPLEMIGNVIVQLVNLRRQLIQDIYEISGSERHHARLDRSERDAGRSGAQEPIRFRCVSGTDRTRWSVSRAT